MPWAETTAAFVRPVPYLLVRGTAQRLSAPLRHGSGGALVAPSAGTVSVIRPDGSSLVSAAPVSIVSSVAGYDLAAPAAAESLGSGWSVVWTLTVAGFVSPPHRASAYLCEYVPPNVISEADLYVESPELKARVPQAQGPRGDNTGWQPQIDAAYWRLIQRLLDDGKRPWLIREVTAYREWLLIEALRACIGTITYGPETSWEGKLKQLHFRMKDTEARFRIQYSDDAPGTRRGRGPVINLCAVGRPTW